MRIRSGTKEELELELLQELDIDTNIPVFNIKNKEVELFNSLIYHRGNFDLCYILKIIDENGKKNVIFTKEEDSNYAPEENLISFDTNNLFSLKDFPDELKERELLLYVEGRYSSDKTYFIKIDPEVFNPEFLNTWRGRGRITLEEFKDQEITKPLLENRITEIEKEEKEREEARKIETAFEEKERLEMEKQEAAEIEIYYKVGVYNNPGNHIKVNDNMIILGKVSYITDKPLNQIMKHSELKYIRNYYDVKRHFLRYNINFEYHEEGNKKYGVKYTPEGKVLINDIPIRKDRIGFIIERLEGGTKTSVIILNRITGVEAALLEVKNIDTDSHKDIPLKFDVKDIKKREYTINIFDTERNMSYDDIKKIFVCGRRIRSSLNFNEFKTLIGILNIPKQDIFDYLRKMNLARSLKE